MRSKFTFWLALTLLTLTPSFAYAQPDTGSIHGHAQDPLGKSLPDMQVVLSLNGTEAKYTFATDQNGDYKGSGIKPNVYVVTLLQSSKKYLDRFTNVKITAGSDTLQDFDLSRPDYIKSLPPDQQKAIEDTKQKNAAIVKENQDIGKLNALLKEARQDDEQKKYDEGASLMQQAVQSKPDAAVLWLELGVAQNGQKKYDDAIPSLKKAIALNSATSKPNPEIEAAANNLLGEAYLSTGKTPEGTAAYDAATKAMPQNAATYYGNEAIVLNRLGKSDEVIAAADKAIAADPKRPIPYYLKGQALISKATVDPKTQKIVAPPGTAEAYEKYLELAPNGPFAPEVQQVLAQIGTKVNNKYTAGKKH